jgi:hypothetical protein
MTTASTRVEFPKSGKDHVSPSSGIVRASYTEVYPSLMKLLVCGPRIWLEQKPIHEVLCKFPKGTILVQGGARGADSIAGFVGEILGFEVREYAVDPKLDGEWPAAGIRRNMRMLSAEHPSSDGTYIDVGIALKLQEELSRGTADMARRLRAAQPTIDVREVLWRKSLRSPAS